MKPILRIVAIIVLTCATLTTWPALNVLAAGNVQPSSGDPGTPFSFTANGYTANERIDTWINTPTDEPQPVAVNAVADADGAVAWQWTAPPNANGGTWRMVARGRISRVETIIPVQINGPAPAPDTQPASDGANPTSGGPGTLFTLTASGFTPDERLDTWANTPNGAQRDVPTWIFANAAGVATWQWTAPADAEGGSWQLIGRGIESRTVKVITIQIDGEPERPAPRPNQGVSPSNGPPGTAFTFYAEGFQSDEEINFWATAPNNDVQTNAKSARANQQGRVEWSWTAPADAAPGVWTMTALGAGSRVIRQLTVVIDAVPTTPLPADGVVPPNGGPGTTFHFGASGFEHEAYLTYWTVDPNGVISSQAARFRADRNGHAEFDWVAPDNAPGGIWQMTVYGVDSVITKVIPFRIDRDTPPVAPAEGVTPYSGTYGTELHFFAEGLPPNVLLGYWATDPAGVVVPIGREVKANSAGRAEWSWTIPQTVRTGLWTMTIRRSQGDRTNAPDITRSIRFEVR